MTSQMIFTEIQRPNDGQMVRFWPTARIDRDPNHPGMRGLFKNNQFRSSKAPSEWPADSVYVWRPADEQAESVAAAGLREAALALDVAAEKCMRAGFGKPVATYLDEARRSVAAALAETDTAD